MSGDITVIATGPKEVAVNVSSVGVKGDGGEGVPPGGTIGQVAVKQSATDYDTAWVTLAPVATSGAYADLSGKPTLGTAAATAATDYATAAQGGLADSALQPGALIPWTDVSGKPALFSGAYADLTGIPATFTPSAHGHVIGDVTGLQSALDGKQPLATVLTNTTASFTTAQETKLAGIAAGAQVNVATDLTYDAATRLLASSTGAGATLPLVTTTDAGLMRREDKEKLDAITGTNTGDQTGIVGITGTKAQFDAAVTDGNFLYVGDAPTAHTHLLAAGATDVTITAANLNALDDGVNTALHFHDADRARANHTGTQLASTISDFASAVAATAAVTANTAKVTNATHTGDVTGATALTIANDAVTYAKMQNVSAASKLLGRGDSGAGDPQEITLGAGLTMTGTTLSASGGGGGSGDVVGPASATDDAMAGFDGTTGKLIKAGSKTLAQVAGIVDEVVTARGDRSALGLRINTISNFASPNAGGIITGLYYDNAFHVTGSQTSGALAGRAAMGPFYTSTPMRIDQIGVAVVTGVVGCLAKCFIYGSNADGWPSDLLYVGGSDLDCSVTAYVAHTLDFTFESGRQYWLGAWVNNAVSFRGVPIASAVNLGLITGNTTTYQSVVRRAVTYGTSLPDPWTLITSDMVAGVAPFSIRMRAAAL